jgi:hypothetical protein
MGRKREPARKVAQHGPDGVIWIDHAAISRDDIEWLREASYLTLWNVTVPDGLLASLTALRGLEIRGGSGTNLDLLRGCKGLQCLTINQMRGLQDVSILASLAGLERLDLFGLRQVKQVPSLGPLRLLRCLWVGQMRGLDSIGPLLEAQALEELVLSKQVPVAPAEVARIKSHPALQGFEWFAEDVPDRVWVPVVDAIHLARVRPLLRAEEWFEQRNPRA